MPELTKLAKQNLNFSHSDKLGGSIVRAPSIAYTMGATIAQTSGVLLMTPLGKMRNDMGELKSFLPSLRRLEDVLHDNGYEQLYIEGSDASFAAYNSYVGRYDDSNVFDLYKARDEGLIPKNYFEMWGFEDREMFEFPKASSLKRKAMSALPITASSMRRKRPKAQRTECSLRWICSPLPFRQWELR